MGKEDKAILDEAGMCDLPTPWLAGTVKRLREDKYHTFADYESWEAWSRKSIAADSGNWWEYFHVPHKVRIYEAMQKACRHTAEKTGWKDKK
ncbi:MAG: hypothetical protein IIB77_13615 [Proteobacteria bacterium]|nr:hypothetical protein [Pseudomonadota bacterium]